MAELTKREVKEIEGSSRAELVAMKFELMSNIIMANRRGSKQLIRNHPKIQHIENRLEEIESES